MLKAAFFRGSIVIGEVNIFLIQISELVEIPGGTKIILTNGNVYETSTELRFIRDVYNRYRDEKRVK